MGNIFQRIRDTPVNDGRVLKTIPNIGRVERTTIQLGDKTYHVAKLHLEPTKLGVKAMLVHHVRSTVSGRVVSITFGRYASKQPITGYEDAEACARFVALFPPN